MVHKRLLGVRIFQIGPHYDLNQIYSADAAKWNGNDWIFSGLKVLNVNRPKASVVDIPRNLHLDAKPGDFSFAILSPEEFSLSELDAYILKLRRNGLDPAPTWSTAT